MIAFGRWGALRRAWALPRYGYAMPYGLGRQDTGRCAFVCMQLGLVGCPKAPAMSLVKV